MLRAEEYGGDEDFSWVMLEPVGGGARAPPRRPRAPLQGRPENIHLWWLSAVSYPMWRKVVPATHAP